ncbi:MAG TPA: flagellar hook-basal body complex protein [Bacillota bacterium]|nr:flagellar hook-basal body complex protein [Clostridiales bacterium]HPT85454.1 flagellar hook-basal body complex protein [Bacillota bacterium]
MDGTIRVMATGLRYRTLSLNVTANNIANANTNGYRRQQVTAGEFQAYLSNRIDSDVTPIGNENRGVEATGVYTDQRFGSLYLTDSMFDFALDGEGSFTLEGAGGGQILTRDGHFQVGADGYLTDAQGNYVLGENGRIYVGQRGYIWVSEAGNIYVNGRLTNRFMINAPGRFNGRVLQRCLERSNVRPLDEMMKMIEDSRAFQTYSRVVATADKILEKTVNEIGRV